MKKRMHVFFSGMVQGVGFRFTCEDMARDLGISGWIRNLHDGRVELVAEGYEEVLLEMVDKINNYFSTHIEKADMQWEPPTGEFEDFNIAF